MGVFITEGVCRFCGQMVSVGECAGQEAADREAAELCDCPEARMERRIMEQIDDARKQVKQLFGAGAEELGFVPIDETEPVVLMEGIVELVARRLVSSATIQLRGVCRSKISRTAKGKIKVERSETRSCKLEVGE